MPYAKPGERYSALLGGHVDALYSPAGNVTSFVENKRMRPVLVLDAERMKEYPAVPTSPESGYDIALPQRRAIIVRAGIDPARVKLLSEALARAVANPRYKAYLKESFASEQSYVPTQGSLELMQRVCTTAAVQRRVRRAVEHTILTNEMRTWALNRWLASPGALDGPARR